MATQADGQHPKRFHRSDSDKMIGGVCGGLAEYYNADPAIIRIIFVLLALAKGFGVLLYIILVIVLPVNGGKEKEKTGTKKVSTKASDFIDEVTKDFSAVTSGVKGKLQGGNTRNVFAVVVILIGLIALLNQLFPVVWSRGDILGPALLILIGAWILAKK